MKNEIKINDLSYTAMFAEADKKLLNSLSQLPSQGNTKVMCNQAETELNSDESSVENNLYDDVQKWLNIIDKTEDSIKEEDEYNFKEYYKYFETSKIKDNICNLPNSLLTSSVILGKVISIIDKIVTVVPNDNNVMYDIETPVYSQNNKLIGYIADVFGQCKKYHYAIVTSDLTAVTVSQIVYIPSDTHRIDDTELELCQSDGYSETNDN